MVNLTSVTNALKNFYIQPLREDINLKADAFASRVLHTSNNINGYNEIIRAAQIGANGGAGAGTETGNLPTAGENIYIQMKSTTKNLYGTLSVSDKALKSITGAPGAFVNAFQQDMDTLVKTLRWNVARQFYGDGSGKLCTLAALATAGKKLTASDSTQFLLPGLKVDLHAADGTVASGHAGLRIADVDHVKKTVTLDTAVTCAAGAYLTIQGSAGYELTGLGKIFETISGTTQTLYGLNRSDYSWLRPYLNANFGAIDEVGMQKVIDNLEDTYNVTIDHINCGNAAYGHYMDLMNKRRAINDVMILEGGHKALKFNGIPLTRNKFMPDAGIDLYDTSLFTVDQIADWEWIEGETRQILHQVPGKPIYTASVTKYCDLMCALPGGIARLTGVSAAT